MAGKAFNCIERAPGTALAGAAAAAACRGHCSHTAAAVGTQSFGISELRIFWKASFVSSFNIKIEVRCFSVAFCIRDAPPYADIAVHALLLDAMASKAWSLLPLREFTRTAFLQRIPRSSLTLGAAASPAAATTLGGSISQHLLTASGSLAAAPAVAQLSQHPRRYVHGTERRRGLQTESRDSQEPSGAHQGEQHSEAERHDDQQKQPCKEKVFDGGALPPSSSSFWLSLQRSGTPTDIEFCFFCCEPEISLCF
ncbi:hypothetical protein cyc_02027 [Cyclospora cayetanensis]|uniref:Uncharacterized protein n=1 Tax=Cyclospora cayetanensis TaxID=88456 RepID=A0A1D3CWA5_9EIME|nr:hypothetical protein cyc_02027 [Cyclospora cayetanensis]